MNKSHLQSAQRFFRKAMTLGPNITFIILGAIVGTFPLLGLIEKTTPSLLDVPSPIEKLRLIYVFAMNPIFEYFGQFVIPAFSALSSLIGIALELDSNWGDIFMIVFLYTIAHSGHVFIERKNMYFWKRALIWRVIFGIFSAFVTVFYFSLLTSALLPFSVAFFVAIISGFLVFNVLFSYQMALDLLQLKKLSLDPNSSVPPRYLSYVSKIDQTPEQLFIFIRNKKTRESLNYIGIVFPLYFLIISLLGIVDVSNDHKNPVIVIVLSLFLLGVFHFQLVFRYLWYDLLNFFRFNGETTIHEITRKIWIGNFVIGVRLWFSIYLFYLFVKSLRPF